jgi:putative flippase GtrA
VRSAGQYRHRRGTIAIGLHCGLGDYAANAAGYGLGLVSSYILNRRFTFRARAQPTDAKSCASR